MFRFFLLSSAILAASVAAANAQEWKGKCSDLKGADVCAKQDVCHWVNRKVLTLPNGQTADPSTCAFKPGAKAAMKAAGLTK